MLLLTVPAPARRHATAGRAAPRARARARDAAAPAGLAGPAAAQQAWQRGGIAAAAAAGAAAAAAEGEAGWALPARGVAPLLPLYCRGQELQQSTVAAKGAVAPACPPGPRCSAPPCSAGWDRYRWHRCCAPLACATTTSAGSHGAEARHTTSNHPSCTQALLQSWQGLPHPHLFRWVPSAPVLQLPSDSESLSSNSTTSTCSAACRRRAGGRREAAGAGRAATRP